MANQAPPQKQDQPPAEPQKPDREKVRGAESTAQPKSIDDKRKSGQLPLPD